MKSISKCATFAVLALGFLAVTGPGWAQEGDPAGNAVAAQALSTAFAPGSGAPAQAPETYGVSSWSTKAIPAYAFHGFGGSEYSATGGGGITHLTGPPWYETTFQLPNGAILYGVTAHYYDNSATQEFGVYIYRWSIPGNTGGSFTTLYSFSSGVAAVPGWSGVYQDFPAAETIKDFDVPADAAIYYHVRIGLSGVASDPSVIFTGMTLWYKLQVSPAPGVATFTDVPTGYWAFQYIEALKASGITQGVTPTTYEPESNVTRAQMAVFLAKALGLHWPSY